MVCGLGMDHTSPWDKDTEFDLESGLLTKEDESAKVCTPDSAKQTTSPIAKLFDGIAGVLTKAEDWPSLHCNDSNLNGVSAVDVMKVTNKSLAGQGLVDHVDKIPVKEKRKKSSSKKAPKPPRPPQGPKLDAADQILIREISELAMLKRARIERMKAVKKMKAAKASSSSSCSSIFAMIFTIIFCIVIIYQGNLCNRSNFYQACSVFSFISSRTK